MQALGSLGSQLSQFTASRSPPYAQGEVFYSRATRIWNKTTYQFGAGLPFRKRFDFELYYEHDNSVGSAPNHVNAFGLTNSIHF
jgi:hypothetical protein